MIWQERSQSSSAETGLFYVGSRYYDAVVGRWINADGLVDNRGLNTQNMFQYCGNNPVSNVDPSGNLFFAILGIAALVVGVAALLSGCSSKPTPAPSTPAPSKPTPSTPAPSTPAPSKPSLSIPSGGKSVYKGQPRICTDGSDGTKVAEWKGNHNPETSYRIDGKYIDAYTVPYVVLPAAAKNSVGKWYYKNDTGFSFGDSALVINWDTGDSVWCVIGTNGPVGNGWGEVSISALWATGHPDHMTAKHADGISSNYEIIMYKGKMW